MSSRIPVFSGACFGILLALSGVARATPITTVTVGVTINEGDRILRACGGPGTALGYCSAFYSRPEVLCIGNFPCRHGFSTAGGTATASSSFGALSGEIHESGTAPDWFNAVPFDVFGNFTTAFNNLLRVTGGTGAGTLIAHFDWAATGMYDVGWAPWSAYFEARLGPPSGPVTTVECLSYDSRSRCSPLITSGAFDISTPFTFGQLTPIYASLQSNASLFGQYVGSSGPPPSMMAASLTLAGFSVYDEAGNLVSGAHVAPIPEPGSIELLLCGALALLPAYARLRARQSSGKRASAPAP